MAVGMAVAPSSVWCSPAEDRLSNNGVQPQQQQRQQQQLLELSVSPSRGGVLAAAIDSSSVALRSSTSGRSYLLRLIGSKRLCAGCRGRGRRREKSEEVDKGSAAGNNGRSAPHVKRRRRKSDSFRTKGAARTVQVWALDAAQPFDYESIVQAKMDQEGKMKIGILGFGNFGQFLAKRILQHNHEVLAHSRSDYSAIAKDMGVSFFRDPDDFCEEHPEVVVVCTSILSTKKVLSSVPLQRLRRSTLFVDMLSVKEFPKKLFLQLLPAEFDILCTHPMFGPESGKGSWTGLPLVYEKVRVREGKRRENRVENFLQIFQKEGCRMVEMSCEEHDRHAASTQFITHTVGRVLGKFGLESTPINTKGYETLLNLVENTQGDSFDLYYGLFMYNVNATEELERLERAFDSVKKQLFDQLHDILRNQLFGPRTKQMAAPADAKITSSKSSSTKVAAVEGVSKGLKKLTLHEGNEGKSLGAENGKTGCNDVLPADLVDVRENGGLVTASDHSASSAIKDALGEGAEFNGLDDKGHIVFRSS